MNSFLIDYPDSIYPGTNLPFMPPVIKSIKINHPKTEGEFYIKKISATEFELHDLKTKKLLLRSSIINDPLESSNKDTLTSFVNPDNIGYASINTNEAEFKLKWDAPVGSVCEFKIEGYYMVLYNLGKKISVSRIGKTNVFEIAVQTPSPFTAKLIANTIIDKFRDARIEQQKQTIQYSFKFVDEQLEDIRTKLLNAENNLSNFKASGQFITINESSRELINFLSTLEAEKLQTDLLLTDYKNKVEDMRSELQSSGYFDQSYLEPEGEFDSNSPFSVLMRQLSDLELRRLELLQKRTENHPDVKSLDEQIKLAKSKLASYNQNTLTAYQIIINTLEKKLVKISNLMSKYEV
ncbi:MAG: hypothetical protein R3321_07825, partial [Nitrososphaeraceae archaeon]|nr:hypothetical protein [Nitrososphaeraceae archaeon]